MRGAALERLRGAFRSRKPDANRFPDPNRNVSRQPDLLTRNGATRQYPHGSVCADRSSSGGSRCRPAIRGLSSRSASLFRGKKLGFGCFARRRAFWPGAYLLQAEDYFQAKPILQELTATYPDSLPAARANYLLAQIAASENNFSEAAEYLTAYQQARPGVLDAFVLEQVGDLQAQAGENELALEAYSAAYLASDPSQNASLAIKVGGAYEKLGQLTPAAAIYRDVYARTEDIYLKAQLDLLLGRVSIAQGLVEEGFEYYQHAVDNYPETYDAFSAVLALLDAEQPVDELQRGLINYFRGQYDLANEAFSRYLEGDGLEKDKALYYQALAVRAKGLELAELESEERFALNQSSGTPQDQTL